VKRKPLSSSLCGLSAGCTCCSPERRGKEKEVCKKLARSETFFFFQPHLLTFASPLAGVTILLSLTVFHNIVTDTLPSVSDAIPLLG